MHLVDATLGVIKSKFLWNGCDVEIGADVSSLMVMVIDENSTSSCPVFNRRMKTHLIPGESES